MKNEYADLHTEANRLEKQIEQAMKQFDQIAVEKTNMQQDIEQVMLSKTTNGTTAKFTWDLESLYTLTMAVSQKLFQSIKVLFNNDALSW